MVRHGVLATLFVLVGCGDDSGEPPMFPVDYADTYQEVRDCRFSLEHDLVRIRVLASPDALIPYQGRTAPFPTGAIVLKEQYDESDTSCTGPISSITAMQKLDVGASPTTLGWDWQVVDARHRVATTEIERCTQCHVDCGQPGYDATCTEP